jgi:hypothetical protein
MCSSSWAAPTLAQMAGSMQRHARKICCVSNSAAVPQLPAKCEIANALSNATDAPTLSLPSGPLRKAYASAFGRLDSRSSQPESHGIRIFHSNKCRSSFYNRTLPPLTSDFEFLTMARSHHSESPITSRIRSMQFRTRTSQQHSMLTVLQQSC